MNAPPLERSLPTVGLPDPSDPWPFAEERARAAMDKLPPIPELILENIFIRRIWLKNVGDCIHGHEHNFHHTTVVFTGAMRVTFTEPVKVLLSWAERIVSWPWRPWRNWGMKITKDSPTYDRDYYAPDFFLTRKGVRHKLAALEAYTQAGCFYSHHNAQGRVTLEYTGSMDAYR
jgi:hypothetical protein